MSASAKPPQAPDSIELVDTRAACRERGSLTERRAAFDDAYRGNLRRVLQTFVIDGSLPAERLEAILADSMRQAEPAIDAAFTREIGCDALN